MALRAGNMVIIGGRFAGRDIAVAANRPARRQRDRRRIGRVAAIHRFQLEAVTARIRAFRRIITGGEIQRAIGRNSQPINRAIVAGLDN